MEDSGGGEKKRVVVVGGGVAGSLIAKTLQDHANVVLIDSKEYFEIPWATLRSLVEPSFAERSIINHNEYLPNVHLVVSTAINITESEVLTTQGSPIAYDYLVIATGRLDTGALARSEKLNHYQVGPQTRTMKLNHYQADTPACNSIKAKLSTWGYWDVPLGNQTREVNLGRRDKPLDALAG
ncbi:hypothetical protein U1Q18_025905 [Sarracenia purpurea var. burkii]